MKTQTRDLTAEYSAALREYLEEGGEAALLRAYQVGRAALGEGLGVLELDLPADGRRLSSRGRVREVRPGKREDRAARNLIQRHWAPLAPRFERVVGRLARPLTRSFEGEGSLGDAVCDAFREATGARVALMNAGGLRTDLPRGAIRHEALYAALPFDNRLVVVELSGRDLLETLEQSARSPRGMLQVSGVEVLYDMTRPERERVISVRVGGEPLVDSRTYSVATVDFLAGGADGFVTLARAKQEKGKFSSDYREAFRRHLSQHSPYEPAAPGRISFVEPAAASPTAVAQAVSQTAVPVAEP